MEAAAEVRHASRRRERADGFSHFSYDQFANVGGAPGSAPVTLSYQTQTQGAPTFSGNTSTESGGWDGSSVSPASGTMTQASYASFLYTYGYRESLGSTTGTLPLTTTETGTVSISSGGGIVSVPVTLDITALPLPQPTENC